MSTETKTNKDSVKTDFKTMKSLPFLSWRWISLGFSFLIILIGVVFYFMRGGLHMGIDFTGGTRIEVHVDNKDASVNSVRSLFTDPTQEVKITTVGAADANNFLITISSNLEVKKGVVKKEEAVKKEVLTNTTATNVAPAVTAVKNLSQEDITIINLLKNKFGKDKVVLRGKEFIGGKMGELFAFRSVQLILIVSVLILIYVALRFDFIYGIGAVSALFHDILIMLTFSVIFGIRVDIPIIAAFLTIIGYSINDTIVIFDRVRENHKLNPDENFKIVMNKSISQSLSRTVVTSLTTLFVAIAIFGWSGRVLRDFGLLMIIGVISGTYSSIFVASPVTFIYRKLIHPVWLDVKEKGKGLFISRNIVAWAVPFVLVFSVALIPLLLSKLTLADASKLPVGLGMFAGIVLLGVIFGMVIGNIRWNKNIVLKKDILNKKKKKVTEKS